MASQDPSEVLRIHLSTVPPPALQHLWKAAAHKENIQVVKELHVGHYGLYAAQYPDTAGFWHHCAILLRQDTKGIWQVQNACFFPEHRPKISREVEQLYALSGGNKPLWMAGYFNENPLSVAFIRLVSSDGHLLEDTIQQGYVLFLSDQQLQLPIEAELYTEQAALIDTFTAFPFFPEETATTPPGG